MWFVIVYDNIVDTGLYACSREIKIWMCGSVGRVSDSRPEGRRFKIDHVHFTFWTFKPFLKLRLATFT